MSEPGAAGHSAITSTALQKRPADPTDPSRRRRRPYATAALFVLPYLILMLAWAGSNPPGAAPDEADHLVKALGIGRLHIGETYRGVVSPTASLVQQRNASISRVVTVPGRLAPIGYKCTAHHPERTADCLPKQRTDASATVEVVTPVGSYPPFLYLPIGLAANAMSSVTGAFLAGRFACVAMAAVLLFFGAAHLVRWLGRRALLGAFVGLTPMALYSAAMISTSGVEICAAFALACVGVVAIRCPNSLRARSTHFTLAGSGAALILSRQLGSVTFAAIIFLVVIRVGWHAVWQLIRRHQASFLGSAAILIVSVALVAWWERAYDHPVITGGVFDRRALDGFNDRTFKLVREGVGLFGWLDTEVPGWVILAWILLVVVLVGVAVLLGSTANRWSLVGWLIALVLLAYSTYATVFYPIRAGIQARHLLPFFLLCPLLAGVVFLDVVGKSAPAAVQRMFFLVAAVMPTIHFASIFVNARRYAVGDQGPVWFLGSANWSPGLGWSAWLILSFIGALALGYAVVACSSPIDEAMERSMSGVEG